MGEQPGTPSRWRERVRDWSSRADWELMEALKAGQPAALAALYDRYAGLVYGLAFKILGHVAEAEDLTQEVFVELWRKVGCDPRTPSESRERRGSLSSFLCILTRSRAIDRLRSQGSHQLLLKRWQTILSADSKTRFPFEQVSIEERRQAVQAALSQLPENQRQILELLYYQGLSQADIARQLGIPLGTVKTRSRQALCKLRGSLRALLGFCSR
ncbi:sigma-70 family RNA polymerase sigma factor [Thermostichus sp. OS-CIW-31]|jgi:RNA polymerase sigma-70 factor (ECF subfamily)|nr:sigma-70 family RNA polymerase sigma factor [Cyanobacteriota bacterium PSP.bin.10]